MSARKKKLFAFRGLRTNADFAEREKALSNILLRKENAVTAGTLLMEIGWLYDQWALILPMKLKKIYQRKARAHFKQSLQKGAKRWSAFNGLGTVELHKGNYKKALEYYKKMHTLHRSSMSYNALGNVYRQLGKCIVAKRNYEHALRLSNNTIEKSAAKYNLSQLKKF